jgi:beta-lactam-binding protein with PASTA domain
MAAGVARPNPDARIQYPRDAYADGPARAARSRRATGEDVAGDDDGDVEPGGNSRWLWISALLAIGVLALAAFLVIRLLSGPGEAPVGQVQVPRLVGLTFEQARQAATAEGLLVEQAAFVQSSAAIGTVIVQVPAEGETVDVGTTIDLTMAIGPELTIVPDLRLRTETEAFNLIIDAGLSIGTRTDGFDAIVPAGSVISQEPGAGQSVLRDTPVSFVVSKGPEPSPTPSPTPTPPPPPTAPPPPPPTATPTQAPITVDDYRCTLLALAQAEIQNDGLTVGSVSGPNDPAAIVVWQNPEPGDVVPPGTEVDLTTVDAPAPTCPAPP